jgi:hypothetical protein
MPAIRQSALVNEAGVQNSTVTAASITGVASGNMLIAVVAAHCPTSVQTGDIVSGYTSSPSNTWTLATGSRSAQTVGTNRTETTIWVAHNVAAGTTTGKPTFTASTNPGHLVWHHMDEWAGMVTSSSVDKAGTATAPENSPSITIASTATLAQAAQVVYCVAACRYNYDWNGSSTAPGAASATYTVVQGTTDNTSLIVAQSQYKEVTSTAGVGVTWMYAQQAGDRGAVASLATFKKAGATPLRLEIDNIDSTDITGTTGWTIGAWAQSPFQTGAASQCSKVWTSYSATVTSGKLILPDAPPGASASDTYNVAGYQPSGTLNLAWTTGVVRVVT